MMSWDLQFSEMKGIKQNPLALGKASNTQSTAQLGNRESDESSHSAQAWESHRCCKGEGEKKEREREENSNVIRVKQKNLRTMRREGDYLPKGKLCWYPCICINLALPLMCSNWSRIRLRHFISLLVCLWSAWLILFSWIWSFVWACADIHFWEGRNIWHRNAAEEKLSCRKVSPGNSSARCRYRISCFLVGFTSLFLCVLRGRRLSSVESRHFCAWTLHYVSGVFRSKQGSQCQFNSWYKRVCSVSCRLYLEMSCSSRGKQSANFSIQTAFRAWDLQAIIALSIYRLLYLVNRLGNFTGCQGFPSLLI